MEKINKQKAKIIKQSIDLDLFKVAKSLDKKDWILLKNKEKTPLFLDTSKFISHPKLLKEISFLILELIKKENIKYDKILGLPYGGLPFAYNLSFFSGMPCVAVRKEGVKKYSTAGEILGDYKKKQKVLLIEDATVTAKTATSFVNRIRSNNLLVSDIITVLDVGALASDNMKKEKIKLHALFTWSDFYKAYKKKNKSLMSKDMINFLDNFLKV